MADEPFTFERLCHGRLESSSKVTIPVRVAADKKGKTLVVLDNLNHVDVFDVKKRTWLFRLPTLQDGIPSSLSVASIKERNLKQDVIVIPVAVPTSKGFRDEPSIQLRLFSIQRRQFLKRMEAEFALIPWLSSRQDKILGVDVVMDDTTGKDKAMPDQSMFLWSTNWIARIQLPQLRYASEKYHKWAATEQKDIGSAADEGDQGMRPIALKRIQRAITVTHRYHNILNFSVVGHKAPQVEAMVVERPWAAIQMDMPAPVDSRTFGS
jgi:hypothetical protein